jgi:NodT family efflux transporter outer membrane factor (OMF) lipoprotein
MHLPRVWKLALACGMALAISAGCEVGLDYSTPKVRTPSRFGEASASQPAVLAISHWWRSFNDPELNTLIDRAVLNNNTLLEAEMRVREARAQLGVEWGTEFPTGSINASASRKQASDTVNPSSGLGTTSPFGPSIPGSNGEALTHALSSFSAPRKTELYQSSFDAGWEIDVFGGNRRRIESANATLEAEIDARQNVLVSLTAEVALDYVLLRSYQLQLNLTKQNVASEQKTLELTKDRYGAGLVTDLDVAQAQTSVATTLAQEPLLEIDIKQTIHAISILLGQEPMALEGELSVQKACPPIPSEIPVGMPSDLLRRRPDVRQAERELAASTANIGVAVSDLFPKISLTGSFGQQTSRVGLIARDASSIWSIGPTVSWQILDYNQLQSQVRVANAQQQQALYAYRQTVLLSFRDVEDALVAYVQDQIRSRALNDELVSSQRSFDLATQLYQRGLGDFLNVQTAERGLYTAQLDLAISQSRVATDLVQLYKALGGGWSEEDEPRFAKIEDPSLSVNVPADPVTIDPKTSKYKSVSGPKSLRH